MEPKLHAPLRLRRSLAPALGAINPPQTLIDEQIKHETPAWE